MTLFVTVPNRRFEISDAYIMALGFIISFLVVKGTKKTIEKLKERKKIMMANPRGGSVDFRLKDENELGQIILTCINDDKQYLVLNDDIKTLIFKLVKVNMTNQSLILTPNMIRFLAINLLTNNEPLIMKVGKAILTSDNRTRLTIRFIGGSVIGAAAALNTTFITALPYCILLTVAFFYNTENCGRQCSDYFEQLPQNSKEVIQIYSETEHSNLVIAGNDNARQVEIYVPLEKQTSVSFTENTQPVIERKYKASRKKAKQVNFSDFKKTDPVLSSFKDLREPYIKQNVCPLTDMDDIMDVRID